MKHLGKIALALAFMGMIVMSLPSQASDVFETYFINVNGVMHEINYDPSLKLLDDRVNGKLIFADVYGDEESNEVIHKKIDSYITGLEKSAKGQRAARPLQDEEIVYEKLSGSIYSIIDGKPIKGWGKFGEELFPIDGLFESAQEYDHYEEILLQIKTEVGYMNIDKPITGTAMSPLEFHVSPTDPTSPFWHNGELTTDMWEGAVGKWTFYGNDYKTDPWIHIF